MNEQVEKHTQSKVRRTKTTSRGIATGPPSAGHSMAVGVASRAMVLDEILFVLPAFTTMEGGTLISCGF
jgi:hypothetical protein